MRNTKHLTIAKNNKRDEFYTQLITIEKEMKYYYSIFKNKIIYCNCDDYRTSKFWEYFHKNFSLLGLKELICTYYTPDNPVYKMVYNGGNDENIANGKVTLLKGNGDFRSQECIDILEYCDIVITNPPFSLFKEYVKLMMKYKKKFLILGNLNAVTYKDIFPLIMNKQIWLGKSIKGGDIKFRVPPNYPLNASKCRIDSNGEKYINVTSIRWFTNLGSSYETKPLDLKYNYYGNESFYPQYDNYNAIDCSRTSFIPKDYYGIIGVPITFLDKYCPKQFDIVGVASPNFKNISKECYKVVYTPTFNDRGEAMIKGKRKYVRILIQRI